MAKNIEININTNGSYEVLYPRVDLTNTVNSLATSKLTGSIAMSNVIGNLDYSRISNAPINLNYEKGSRIGNGVKTNFTIQFIGKVLVFFYGILNGFGNYSISDSYLLWFDNISFPGNVGGLYINKGIFIANSTIHVANNMVTMYSVNFDSITYPNNLNINNETELTAINRMINDNGHSYNYGAITVY